MSVVQIRCPHCRSDFIDSRADWKDEDVARCPRCGENVALRRIEVQTVDGSAVHVEPAGAVPINR